VSGPVPEYVEARLRRPPPQGCNVIPGSTPVVGFGDPRNAKVATIGLNPNRLEFLDSEGSLLREDTQRLETLLSVGADSLEKVDAQVLARIFEGCNWYFERNPYRRWFDVLERVLNGIGVSYYRGTACHLTLVQWATNPTWGLLPESSRAELLRQDAPFLRERIEAERIELVLLNGRGVITAFTDTVGCSLEGDDAPIADKVLVLAALAAAAAVLATPAGATNECKGFQVCVPVAGPWVVVPAAASVPRPRVASTPSTRMPPPATIGRRPG